MSLCAAVRTSLNDISLVEPVPACQSVCAFVCLSLDGWPVKYSSRTIWMHPTATHGSHVFCHAAVVPLIAHVTNQDVRQVWNPEDAEEEVLVMVCRTGMHTSMGTIIRQLLTPTKVYKDKQSFLRVGCHTCALLHDTALSATLPRTLRFSH